MNQDSKRTSETNLENVRDNAKRETTKAFLTAGVISVSLCVGYFFAVRGFVGTREHEAQFGDMFGALNAMFTGLALVAAVYAVYMQREDLAIQRFEVKSSIEELQRQTQLFSDELETLRANSERERRRERALASPFLRFDSCNHNALETNFSVLNEGPEVSDVSVSWKEDEPNVASITIGPSSFWQAQTSMVLTITWKDHGCPRQCHFSVTFQNRLGEPDSQSFFLLHHNTYPYRESGERSHS